MRVPCTSSRLFFSQQNISFYSHLKCSLPDLSGGGGQGGPQRLLLVAIFWHRIFCIVSPGGNNCSWMESLKIRTPCLGKQHHPMAVLYFDGSFLSVKVESVSTYRVIQNKSNFSSTWHYPSSIWRQFHVLQRPPILQLFFLHLSLGPPLGYLEMFQLAGVPWKLQAGTWFMLTLSFQTKGA